MGSRTLALPTNADTLPPAQGASWFEKSLWVVCTWDAFERKKGRADECAEHPGQRSRVRAEKRRLELL